MNPAKKQRLREPRWPALIGMLAASGVYWALPEPLSVGPGWSLFAIILILFVAAATFYFHDFWNQTGPEARGNLVHALKNLSLIGALFMIAGSSRSAKVQEPVYDV